MSSASESKEAAASASAPQLIEHIHLPLDYTPFEVKWVPEASRLVSLGAHASGAFDFDSDGMVAWFVSRKKPHAYLNTNI